MRVGYARTSTTDQNNGLDAQKAALTEAKCERIYDEQVSSRANVRPQLESVIDYLRDGDTLVVTKPDRLARSTADLLSLVERIQAKGASLVILSMAGTELDTSKPTSKLMLIMLAAVAEFERDIMLERQREGIAIAKDKGRYKGRPPMPDEQKQKIKAMLSDGMTPTAIAKSLNINRTTVYRNK